MPGLQKRQFTIRAIQQPFRVFFSPPSTDSLVLIWNLVSSMALAAAFIAADRLGPRHRQSFYCHVSLLSPEKKNVK